MYRYNLTLACLLILSTPVDALAQPTPSESAESDVEEPANPEDAELSESESDDLPEALQDPNVESIVITTERREQNLQDVAAVAKVATGDQLRAMGTNQFTDLSNAFPQLNIGNREGNVEVFIRGIGDDNNTELSEPRSAILMDGVYIARPRGLGSFFFDIDRVELNVGPQGTIRGRNATGGSLNIVSTRPRLGEYEAYIDLGYGRFNQREVQAALNVPMGDNLAFRVASYYLSNDAKIENVGVLDVEEARATEDIAFRASLRWDPLDNLSINVIGDFMDSTGTGYGGLDYFPYYQTQFGETDESLSLNSGIQDLSDPWRNVSQGSEARQNQQIWGIRGEATLDLGPVSIQYLSSFRSVDFFLNTPGRDAYFPGFQANAGDNGINFNGQQSLNQDTADFFDTFGRTQFDQVFESIVQELRVFSDQEHRLRWTAGMFFFRETGFSYFNTSADRGFTFAGVEFAFPDVERQSIAGFADATFDITDRLRLTAGIRVTSEELSRSGFGATYLFGDLGQHRFGSRGFEWMGRDRTVTLADVNIDTAAGQAELFRSGIRRYGTSDTIDGLIQGQLDAGNEGAFFSNIVPNVASRTDSYVNWRARLEFDITDDNLVYTSATTGTNSGGFNDAVPTDAGVLAPEFDPESVLVFELGSKNKFRLGRYQSVINIAAFYYIYEDQQFTVLAPAVAGDLLEGDTEDQQGGSVSLRQNVGDSVIVGADIDYTQNLPWYFRFRANVQFLHTEFTSANQLLVDSRYNFPNGEADTITFDPTGNRLPKASDVSGSLTLSKLFNTDLGVFEANVAIGFRTDYFLTIFNGDGTLPVISAENYPELDEDGLTALQNSVRDNAGSSDDRVDGYVR
ncbi:MAG: TonB-dependent receptor, partial [Myxococcales bacterium]|nr:TonB-dependent receptor [Myxococcales bacterium]